MTYVEWSCKQDLVLPPILNKPPRVIQLSRLRSPAVGRGRPYTVDFGIAKPLYKQVLSKLVRQTKPPTNYLLHSKVRTNRRAVLFSGIIKLVSGAHPHWRLITGRKASTRNKLGLITGLVSIYLALVMPLNTPQKIVYADPLIYQPQQTVLPMLTMPSVSAVEAVSELPLPITPPSPVYTFSNLYTPYNCTWYVASRVQVPNDWGNANTWGPSAQLAGYVVSDIPRVGAIAWSTTDSALGHVALVESVVGDVVTISEMNYEGLGVIDSRIANPGEFSYIYL